MPIFALETSTERLSLAIIDGSQTYAREIDAGQRHSELAIGAIADLFAEAGLVIADVDLIAFGQGPGSFVGVRIACGLAQGLALGAGKLLLPVPTQMALAEQSIRSRVGSQTDVSNGEHVLVAIDARMNEIYLAAYQRDVLEATGWRTTISPALVKPDALPTLGGASWTGIGSAFDAPALNAVLEEQYKNAIQAIVRSASPCAIDVAAIAQRQWTRGVGTVNAAEARPLYLRNNVAQTIDERAAAKTDTRAINAAALVPTTLIAVV